MLNNYFFLPFRVFVFACCKILPASRTLFQSYWLVLRGHIIYYLVYKYTIVLVHVKRFRIEHFVDFTLYEINY